MQVKIMVARIAIPNLEVKALLIQIVDPIIVNQVHLAVVTVGHRLARLANRRRMVCKQKNTRTYCIAS